LFFCGAPGRFRCASAAPGGLQGLRSLYFIAPLKNKKNNLWDAVFYKRATPTGFSRTNRFFQATKRFHRLRRDNPVETNV